MNCPSLNKDKRGGLAFRRIFMTNDKLKSCSLSRLDHQIDQQNNILSIDLQLYFLKLTMTKCSGHLRTDSSLIVQNWKCPREGFRAQRRIYFLFFLRIAVHPEIVR